MGQVDTYLVGASRLDPNLQPAVPAEPFEGSDMGEGVAAVARHRHPTLDVGVFSDGLVEGDVVFSDASHGQTEVGLLHQPLFELTGQGALRLQVAGEDEESARVAVDAVDGKDLAVALGQESP